MLFFIFIIYNELYYIFSFQYFCLNRGEEVRLLQGEKPECCSCHTEELCVRCSPCTQHIRNNVHLNVINVLYFSLSTPKHTETQTSNVKNDLKVMFSVSSPAQTAQMHLWKTYKRSWMQESNITARRWLSKSSMCVCVCERTWSPRMILSSQFVDSLLFVSPCRAQIHECSSDPQKPCGSCWWRRQTVWPDETQQ